MTTLWLDFETFSECDLKTHASHHYAAHPSTEITVAAWAIDDGEPGVVDCTTNPHLTGELVPLYDALHDPDVIIYAHNSHFDRTILRHVWGIEVPVERWRDTMVQGMAHSLPGGLEKLGEICGLRDEEAKIKDGKKLIQLFCKPMPKNSKLRRATRDTHPAEWQRFLEYARNDITSMRAIAKRLPVWNVRGQELALWHLDQRINDRGFQCDVELARQAIRAAAAAQATLRDRVRGETEGAVSSATQRDQLLKFILEEHGVELPDLTGDTLKRRLEDPELPESVKILIAIRLEAGMASSSKYKALANAVSPDGRLRNSLQFAGASRTGRWAGRVFQPQNMKRPDMEQEEIDLAIEAIKADALDLVTDEPMRALANVVRGCIVAPEGKKLCIADLSNIEGRMLVWLAGEDWKLKAFSEFDAGRGHDMYKVAYGRAFNVDPGAVDKGQRQIGKVQELALGYEGGVGAFLTFAAVYQMDLDALADAVWSSASGPALHDAGRMHEWVVKKKRSTFGLTREVWIACEVLKSLWREAHPRVVELWADAASAVRSAVRTPGTAFSAGKHIKVQRDGTWLRVRLPSGRVLCYLSPEVDDSGQISYMGVNQYTRQWSRIKTYGGKLVENWTQAAARDVLAANMPEVERRGFEIVLTVHDELLTETPDTGEYTWQELAKVMARVPAWAQGLPLAAAGFEAKRYRKD
jgi:DNA polymerase bacteriophage-type